MIKLSKTVCLFIYSLYIPVFARSLRRTGITQDGLVELGTSVNVTFYAGRHELTWEAGKQYCLFHNLTLAEVHHKNQELFLKDALTELDEFSHYHTGGRTRVGLDSLVWDNSRTPLHAITDVQLNTPEQLCLLIRVPNYDALWETDPCSDAWPPVCQSV